MMSLKILYSRIGCLTKTGMLLTFALLVIWQWNLSAQNITGLEYYFNSDPGFGNGQQVLTGSPVQVLSQFNFNIDVSALNEGFHHLFIRVKDDQQRWSHTHNRMLLKDVFTAPPGVEVAYAEYYFDTDPGFGNGTQLPFSPAGELASGNFSIDISALPLGFHTLYIRGKDDQGKWSHTHHRLFFKNVYAPPPTVVVTQMEYYFNNDPGFGLGVPVAFNPIGNIVNGNFAVDITNLPLGFHLLYVRVKDNSGKWSHTHQRMLFRQSMRDLPPNLVQAEYYFNNDPGFGSGNSIYLPSPETQIDDFTFMADIENLPVGIQKLYVRVKDEDGKWSHTHFKEYCRPPVPGFQTDVVYAGNPTQFTNTSSLTDANTQFKWDVDNDGIVDYTGSTDFQYTYPGAGIYEAKLILVSPEGCSDTLIQFVTVVDCLPPSGLTVTNIDQNTARLQWSPANIETAWNIEYGSANFTLGNGTYVSNNVNTWFDLSGLQPASDYEFYVQSVCGVDEFSAWAGPYLFTTMEAGSCLDAFIRNFPASSPNTCVGSVYSIDFAGVTIDNALSTHWIISPVTAGSIVGNSFVLNQEFEGGEVSIKLVAIAQQPCDNDTALVILQVFELPLVTCPEDMFVLLSAPAVELNFSNPHGGIYAGNGVSLVSGKYSFNAGIAGEGEHVISYTYSDSQTGCTDQCSFTVTVSRRPQALSIKDITIVNQQDTCFTANQYIYVGGTGNPMVVQDGGMAEFEAGIAIYILDETHIQAGGYALFRIENEGNFCDLANSILASTEADLSDNFYETPARDRMEAPSAMLIYPNPVKNRFWLKTNAHAENEVLILEVINLTGYRILRKDIINAGRIESDLSGQPAGIYTVRLIGGNSVQSAILIKQ